MAATLTKNGVRTLTQDGPLWLPGFEPLLQVINMKNVSKPSDDNAHYRLILSDGHQFVLQGYVVRDLNELANRIRTNNIIRIDEYIVQSVKETLVCCILNCVIIDSVITEKIGSPVNVDERYI